MKRGLRARTRRTKEQEIEATKDMTVVRVLGLNRAVISRKSVSQDAKKGLIESAYRKCQTPNAICAKC